jgi:peptidoglycan hydrolase CwlO-like protein
VLFAAVAATPDPFLQNLVSGAVIAAVIGGIFTVAQVLLNKRLRTPADKTEETKLLFEFYRNSREDAIKDKEALEATVKSLRTTVDDLQNRSDSWFTEKSTLQQQIGELRMRIDELEERIRQKDQRLTDQDHIIAQFAANKSGYQPHTTKEQT